MNRRILMSIIVAMSLVSCGKPNSPSSNVNSSGSDINSSSSDSTSQEATIVSLKANLEKTTYYVFETLDYEHLSITLNKSDQSHITVNYSDFESNNIGLKLLDDSEKEIPYTSTFNDIGSYTLSVYSTNNQNLKDSIAISVVEEDFGNIGDEDLQSLKNRFVVQDDKYTAEKPRSLHIFDNYFNKGTFKVDVVRGNNPNDDHLIFAYNQNDHSYYSYGLNLANKIQITYFDGTKLNLVKAFDDVINEKTTFSLAFNSETGAVDYFINDNFLYANNISVTGDLKYGFYAGTKGCVFSDVMVNNDDTLYDNDFNNYQTANGTIEKSGNDFVVTSTNALNFHKSKTFTYGEMEVIFNNKNATNNAGIAFCIDNNGKSTFYRDSGITYYYLCVTISGTVGLYKVANKTATLLKNINTKNFYRDLDHSLRVIRDNKKVIHAFLDDAYCFSYIDKRPLTGNKYGLNSTSSNTIYRHISTKVTFSNKNEAIKNYDVTSGSFYKNGNLIVSDAKKSMILNKNPGSYNGTIEAEISMGKDYGTGLVFRLTKPTCESFYDNASGLSYYWLNIKTNNRIIFGRVDNGTTTWTIEKYMPYFMSNGAKCKIVLDNNHIYAYFSNVLVFHYIDNNPLTGLYYGLRSESEGASICGDITFSSLTAHEQNKYLVFGHSYTQLWHRYKEDFKDLGDDINNIGIGGSQTGTWSKQYKEEVVPYNPEWGIYWNGINDINADVSAATILDNFTTLLLYLKQQLPNFKCVVLSISRCTHEKAMARLEQIADVNQQLKELCASYDWLVYVDVEKIFCDSSGNPIDSYFVDKLHPTPEGYKLVAPLVVNAIKNYGK